jgi:antitoxin VapB
MKTRAFKSGNSQAVRIPAEIAYADVDLELEVVREGDTITVFPAKRNSGLLQAIEKLRQLPKLSHEPIERTLPRKTKWD